MSMFLLLKSQAVRSLLTATEVEEVTTMAPYIAFHYLPWMLSAKYASRWVWYHVSVYSNFKFQGPAQSPQSNPWDEKCSARNTSCHHCSGYPREAPELPVPWAGHLRSLWPECTCRVETRDGIQTAFLHQPVGAWWKAYLCHLSPGAKLLSFVFLAG